MCCGKIPELEYQNERSESPHLLRRQVLKMLVVGSGMLAVGGGLSGCTSLFERHSRVDISSDTKRGTALGVNTSKVDKALVSAVKNQLKKLVRVLNGLDKVSPQELAKMIRQTQRISFHLLDHLDVIGVSAEIDRAMHEIPDIIDVPQYIKDRFINEVADALLPQEILEIRQELSQPITKDLLDPAIQNIIGKGGWSQHMRQLIRRLGSRARVNTAPSFKGKVIALDAAECCIKAIAFSIWVTIIAAPTGLGAISFFLCGKCAGL